MIDSNTYNEVMRIGCRNVREASYTNTDVPNSPESRQSENIAAKAELTEEERKAEHEKAIAYMNSSEAQWFYKFSRRHEANVFNALFKDKEPITEDDVDKRVKRAALFFDLPIPTILKSSDCLAKIAFTDQTELGGEIRYDLKKLEEIGINNVDAFEALITHELSHQYLASYKFNFCRNKNWSMELACDYIVGVRCSANMIASGKYKYAVSQMKASESHPDGEYRLKAVKTGFDFAEWLIRRGKRPTAEMALIGINKFLCEQSAQLNESFFRFMTTPPPPPPKERDIMDLPDNNLIKQYVLKWRAEQAQKQNQQKDERNE